MPSFTRKCQKVFVAAVFTFHTGKPVVQITAIKIAVYHLLNIGPPEAILPREIFIIDLDKGLKIVFYAPIMIG